MEKLSKIENKLPHILNLKLRSLKCRIFTNYPLNKKQGIMLVVTCPQYKAKWEKYLEYETEDVLKIFNNNLSFRFLKENSTNLGKKQYRKKKKRNNFFLANQKTNKKKKK